MGKRVLGNVVSLFRTIYFAFAFTFYILACSAIIPVVYSVYTFFSFIGLNMEKFKMFVGRLWLLATQSLLCILIGDNTHIVYKKNKEASESNTLIISNHTSYIDWAYLWSLLLQIGRRNISFIAKEAIGSIFFLRMGMEMLNFVLLSRNMEQDKARLKEACKTLYASKNYNLVIFPEGTFIDEGTKRKDKEFLQKEIEIRKKLADAEKGKKGEDSAEISALHKTVPENITEVFSEVIFPRVKGFALLLEELKDSLRYIMDCTIYLNMQESNNQYPSKHFTLKNILLGRCSRMQALIVCESIEITPDIIQNPSDWMYNQFHAKDNLLKSIKRRSHLNFTINFYKNKGYTHERIHPSLPITIFLSAGALLIVFPSVFGAYAVLSLLFRLGKGCLSLLSREKSLFLP